MDLPARASPGLPLCASLFIADLLSAPILPKHESNWASVKDSDSDSLSVFEAQPWHKELHLLCQWVMIGCHVGISMDLLELAYTVLVYAGICIIMQKHADSLLQWRKSDVHIEIQNYVSKRRATCCITFRLFANGILLVTPYYDNLNPKSQTLNW